MFPKTCPQITAPCFRPRSGGPPVPCNQRNPQLLWMPGEEQNAKQEIHTADGCSPNSKRPHSSGNVFMVNSSGTSPAQLLVRHQAAAPELGAVAQGTCFLKAQSRKTGTAFLLLYTRCHIAQTPVAMHNHPGEAEAQPPATTLQPRSLCSSIFNTRWTHPGATGALSCCPSWKDICFFIKRMVINSILWGLFCFVFKKASFSSNALGFISELSLTCSSKTTWLQLRALPQYGPLISALNYLKLRNCSSGAFFKTFQIQKEAGETTRLKHCS